VVFNVELSADHMTIQMIRMDYDSSKKVALFRGEVYGSLPPIMTWLLDGDHE
jgi:hypothetical protein